MLDDASDILVKQIKPNFKALGPKFGKDMKLIAAAINQFTSKDIDKIEKDGHITIIINDKNTTLEQSDVEITSKDIEGWLVANEGKITVALDVTITEDLKQEGVARELINRIQNARKDSGLEVTDKIELTILRYKNLETAINNNKNYIMAETLTSSLQFTDVMEDGFDVEFDDIVSKLAIKKI